RRQGWSAGRAVPLRRSCCRHAYTRAAVGLGPRPHAQRCLTKGFAMTTLIAPPVVAPVFPASPHVDAIIRMALAEDVGRGDLTTEATVSPDALASADLLQKAPGVVCGLPVVEAVFARLDPRVRVTAQVEEGSFDAGRRVVAQITGPAAAILTGE